MEAPDPIPSEIYLSEIDASVRVRQDYGDLSSLKYSIKSFGLIQPLVVTWDENRYKLLAGGRRYVALQELGRKSLVHGREIIVREELYDSENREVQIIRQSIELEENLKRKDMSWAEEVEGKRRLLALMQERYGVRGAGGPTRGEQAGTEETGFSLRDLSEQLGESPGMTSRDIQLAKMLEIVPGLKDTDTKTAAFRKLETLLKVITMKKQAKPGSADRPYTLYEGSTLDHIAKLESNSVDLIVTDLPFGVGLGQMSRHATGAIDYEDDRGELLNMLALLLPEAYRILKDDRYAVFFFGFNYYPELVSLLTNTGFVVNKVPFIWYKNTRSTENPNARYGNSYDPALVCSKGSASFIRPGQANFLQTAPVIGKIQVAQQPVEVPERFILDMTASGGIVVDLTAGTGTTGEAALRSGRYPILFEKDPMLCQFIKGRLDSLAKPGESA